MTREQTRKAVEELQTRVRAGSRAFCDSDFIGWGCASLGDARQVVHDFIAAERAGGSGWLVSETEQEVKAKDPETGKLAKKTVREWRVGVDWAFRRTR